MLYSKEQLDWFTQNGFSESGDTYSIVGKNTYSIKEELKSIGCKYSPLLGWHSPNPLRTPPNYTLIHFTFAELYGGSPPVLSKSAPHIVAERVNAALGYNLSEFVGEVGERLRNLSAIVQSISGYSADYGYTYIYTFAEGRNLLVWFTQKKLDIRDDQPIWLTGTVKNHNLYKGNKITILNRCIIKERSD